MTLGRLILRLLADEPGLPADVIATRLGRSKEEVRKLLTGALTPFVATHWESRWFLREQLPEGDQVSPVCHVHPFLTVEVHAKRAPKPKPQSNVPREVFEALEEIYRWAGTEGGIKTVAELLDAAREPDRLPSDLGHLWREAGGSAIPATADFNPFSPILDWYRSLDERRQVILSSRILAFSGARTLTNIASEFGVSRERIRQVQGRLIEDLAQISRTEAWEAVLWRAHRVRQVVGEAFPWGYEPTEALLAADQLWSEVEADVIRGVILRLAGPYEMAHGWLTADAEKLEAARLRLVNEAKDAGSVGFDAARDMMAAAGLHPRVFEVWLAHRSGMREIRRSVIEWPQSLHGRVLSLMRLRGSPADPDDLLADLDPGVDIRYLKATLSSGKQFVRVGVSNWALRTWKLPEYRGIIAAISDELSKNGPSLPIKELATRLPAAFGVAKTSVITLCNAPRFVVERGTVRHRRDDEPFVVSTDLSQAPGVFKLSDNEISVLIDVDHQLLRGSGRFVPEPVAGLLAVRLGQRKDFEADPRIVRLSWADTSISGPAVGSLRVHAQELGAAVGDRLRITFYTDTQSADVHLVGKKRVDALAGDRLLAEVTGLTGYGQKLLVRLAAAVESDLTDLARFLRRRGDTELAEHLPTVA